MLARAILIATTLIAGSAAAMAQGTATSPGAPPGGLPPSTSTTGGPGMPGGTGPSSGPGVPGGTGATDLQTSPSGLNTGTTNPGSGPSPSTNSGK